MAGIILDLNDDIQRLQELKREIQEVKQALTSINVKVDIDIAKGLEDRLKSLMGTYGDLVAKVSQAEASVKASASRMADATRKVTEAQEKASSSGGGKRDGAESVKEQAKAYEELAAEIDAVMGTREQNIKRMVEEQNAIRLIGKEIKTLQSSQSLGSLSKSEQARLESLNASLMAHKTALAELRQSLSNGFKLDNAAATSMNALSQSLGRMRMAYRELSEQERESPFGKELLASIQQADAKIKELDATIGNHQRNVGNYASGWNGLNMSVQQIVRELPSATMGLNMFFLAISNNLPVLTDEIKRAAEANKQMKAQGKETVPVWKQLVSSLFSWQSAMMVGITLLTVYGKDIINWIGSLFKAEDALEETRKAQERFAQFQKKMTNEWRESVAQTAGQNIAAYRKLAREYDALGDSMEKKRKFVRDNQDAFHQLGFSVDGVTDAENLFVRNTDAVVNALVARAKAAAYEQAITKATQRYIEQTEYNKGTVKGGGYYKKVYAGKYNIGSMSDWSKGYKLVGGGGKKATVLYEDMEGLVRGEDYEDIINTSTASGITLTAAGAAKINAKRAKDAAERLRKNDERAEKELNQVVKAATEGIEQQTKAENAVYDKLSLKRYDDRGGTSAGKAAEREADKREEAQEKADKNLLELQRQNQESELSLMKEGTEKQLKEIELRYGKQKDAIKKQAADMAKENQEAGIGGLNAQGLTQEQQTEIDKAYELADETRKKSIDDIHKAELESMRDYLKQWGSLEQKRLAISEEYAQKIADARTEGERKSLEKERDRALSSLNFESISMGIDWKGLLSGVANLSKETLKPMLEQLEAYAKTDEYAQADMDERQKVVDLIQELRQYVGTDQSATWQELAKAIEAFNEGVASYREAAGDERQAVEGLADAKVKLERGEITQADYDKLKESADQLGERTVEAKDKMQGLANSVNELSEQVANQVSPLMEALNNARGWQGVEGYGQVKGSVSSVDQLKGTLDTMLSTMGEGTAKEIGTALSKGMGAVSSSLGNAVSSTIGSQLGSIVGVVAQIPSMILQFADAIKNFVTGILDSISELLSLDWISDLVNSILGAVDNLINTILDLPENLFHVLSSIVVDGVGGLVNSVVGRLGNILSFGALSSGGPAEWFSGSNAEEVQKTIERLTERNKLLQQSIEDLTSTIEGGEGTKSVAAYEEAKRLQEELEANLLEMAKAQAGYVGSHHSWNAYWGGFTQEEIDELSRRIGRQWSGDLFDLSPDEMKELRSMVDTWARIQNTGKGGYGGRLTEKLDDYIEQAGQMEELTDQLNESLTQVSFDSLYDSFVDTLMDMDASAEDLADKFSEYMMRAVLSNQVGETMKDELERWYERFAGYMEDGTLTDMERADLKGWWDSMVDEGMSLRDQLAQAIGYEGEGGDEGQQASAGYELSTSQESVNILNGRMNAVYEAELRIEKNGELLYSVADEARGVIAQSFLELQQISENTGAIIVPIQKMQKDIEQVKKNTSRL